MLYAQMLGLDVQRVISDFCDYWYARSGRSAVKADWNAAWRGWCRRAADWKKNNKNIKMQSYKVMAHLLDGFVNQHQWDDLP